MIVYFVHLMTKAAYKAGVGEKKERDDTKLEAITEKEPSLFIYHHKPVKLIIMEDIYFIKSGDPLKVNFVVRNGVLAVAYWIKLSEKNSNKAVATFEGDNLNSEDDCYYLPMPVDDNNERIIRLSADFYGLDPELSKKYSMGIEVYQGDRLLKYVEREGNLSPAHQSILLFIQLKNG